MAHELDGKIIENRTEWIEAVKKPLSLYTLIILVLESVLIVLTITTDKNLLWMPLLTLLLVILIFSYIVIKKPENLFGIPPKEHKIRLLFQDMPSMSPSPKQPAEFKVTKCQVILYRGNIPIMTKDAIILCEQFKQSYIPYVSVEIPPYENSCKIEINCEYQTQNWVSDSLNIQEGSVGLVAGKK